jgi:hypothetical protein
MGKIELRIILEVLGRPPEHVTEALTGLILRLASEKGVKVIEKTIHEPVLVQDSKDIYTTFAEVHLEVETLANYFGIIFGYMPSNVEIISPEQITLPNVELNDLGNRLLGRLHDYDAIAKKMIFEKDYLTTQLKQFAPHLFKKEQIEQQAVPQETKKKSAKAKASKKKK